MTKIRLPAEWEKQSGIMLTWPQIQSDWSTHYHEAENTFLNIAAETSRHELVLIVCANDSHLDHIAQRLHETKCIFGNVR